MTTTVASKTVNGIDTEGLRGVIGAVAADPKRGATSWRICSTWVGGTRSDHEVNGCRIGGTDVMRRFTLRADEPLQIGGTNQYANPQEYLMAGINACMMVGYAAVAALMGVTLTKLEVSTSGDIDLRGFFQLDPTVPAGYPSLKQVVKIAGDGTPEQFRQLHETMMATSPNYFNITRAVPMASELVVE